MQTATETFNQVGQTGHLHTETIVTQLKDAVTDQALLEIKKTTRTSLAPDGNGLDSNSTEEDILAGCGCHVKLSQISAKCSCRRHRNDRVGGLVCRRCARRCWRCGSIVMAACGRYEPDSQRFFCKPCWRIRNAGKVLTGLAACIGVVLGLLFLEPASQEIA